MRSASVSIALGLMLMISGGCAPDLGLAPVLCNAQLECPAGYGCAKGNICVREGYAHEAPEPDGSDSSEATVAPAGGGSTDAAPDLPDAEPLANSTTYPDPPSKDRLPLLDGAPVKSASGCLDELSEPNNSGAAATPLTRSERIVADLEICYPGDVDLYEVALEVGEQLLVQVRFSHAEGDLEAALLGPDGSLLAEGRSETDNEDFTLLGAAVTGSYLVAVWGFDGATNSYDLQVR